LTRAGAGWPGTLPISWSPTGGPSSNSSGVTRASVREPATWTLWRRAPVARAGYPWNRRPCQRPPADLLLPVSAVLQQELHRLPGPDLYDVRTESVFGHVDPDVRVRVAASAGRFATVSSGPTGCRQHGYCEDQRCSWSGHGLELHPSYVADGSWIGFARCCGPSMLLPVTEPGRGYLNRPARWRIIWPWH
jgi:hypothetical protein